MCSPLSMHWAQVPRSQQHLLTTELSRFQAGSRGPSEQQQIPQNQYDSLNKPDHDAGPKLEDFLGGASSLGGQYNTRSDSHTHNFDNLFFRDLNVNLSPYSGGAQPQLQHQQEQQQANHVQPSFHAYGLQRADNFTTRQAYDSHSRTNTGAACATTAVPAETNLCHSNVHAQDLLQVTLDQHRHHQAASGSQGAEVLSDYPQANLSALNTWLQHSQNQVAAAAASPGVVVNALPSAGVEKHPAGMIGKANIPSLANLHQSLSLSMSPGSQSSNTLQVGPQQQQQQPPFQTETSPETRKRGAVGRAGSKEASPRKSIDNFGQRTSVFRGVTRHRWTGRYEAHLWDNSCRKEGQTRKGRQVYLGGYDKEEKAARAYDLAALKYWGANTTINFPLHQYEKELEEMKNMTRQEYVASLRRKSSGFSRGASVYRGVTRHHQHGRWQARIGRVAGNKDLYLGTYSTQEEAAEAYDIAAIKFRGINAVTNFDISRYDTKRICGTTGATNEITLANNNSSNNKPILHNSSNNMSNNMSNNLAMAGSSNYSHGVTASTKETLHLHHVVHHHQQQAEQQRSEVSVDQTDEDSQSMQTGNTNTSQATDLGLVVSRQSHLQEWQMLYQQQAQRSWEDTASQQHQQQQQDARTQSLISDSLGQKFLPSAASNMHSTVLRNLMGMSDGGASHSSSETSAGLMAGMQGSGSMMSGRYGGPSNHSTKTLTSQLSMRENEEDSSKTTGAGSAYDNVLQQQGDLARHIMYMSQNKGSPPHGSQNSSVTNAGYDSSSLGGSSWMSPQGGGGLSSNGRVNLSVGHGHMPIFAMWNEQ